MDNAQAWTTFFDINARISNITWLPAYFGGVDLGMHDDFVKEVLFEANESYMHESMKKIAKVLEPYLEDDEGFLCEEVGYILMENNLSGFVVEASTPVPKDVTDDSYSFSWGHTHSTFFYVERIEDVVPLIEAWVDDVEEKARKKAKQSVDNAVEHALNRI